MTVIELYFVLAVLQLLHGTEEYLTGWSKRSRDLYQWYRKYLPFVPPDGMSTNFHVLLNFTLGWIFLAAALFVARGEDWAILFDLLEEGKIEPIIAAKFPILEAAKANALLESGQVIGNVVLLAPELLWGG